jgi:outer membrane protein TolC
MKKVIIYILSFIPAVVFSQTLTLEDCRRMAIENNKTLKNASLSSMSAKDEWKAYQTKFLPRLSVKGGYVYSNINMKKTIEGGYLPTFVPDTQTGELKANVLAMGADGTPIFKEYAYMPDIPLELKIGSVWNGGVLFEQPLYMGGKIRSAVKMAKIGMGISKLNVRKSEQEILLQTEEAFWTMIKTEELRKSALRYKEVVSEFYRQMSNAKQSGMKTKNDLLKVQVRLNEAELKCRQAENGLVLARMNLCQKIGLPLTTSDLKLVVPNDDFSAVTDNTLDVTSRPEYEMLQQLIDLKQEEVRLTRSDYLPQLAAIASYSYSNGVKLNAEKLFDSASFTGGITLSIPILHWMEGKKKVSSAKREVEIAKNTMEETSELMRLELMRSLNTCDEAALEVRLTAKSVEQAEENMRMSKDQYDAGLETLGDYLESQALWQKSESDYIDAKAKYRLAYSNYLRCCGKLSY